MSSKTAVLVLARVSITRDPSQGQFTPSQTCQSPTPVKKVEVAAIEVHFFTPMESLHYKLSIDVKTMYSSHFNFFDGCRRLTGLQGHKLALRWVPSYTHLTPGLGVV